MGGDADFCIRYSEDEIYMFEMGHRFCNVFASIDFLEQMKKGLIIEYIEKMKKNKEYKLDNVGINSYGLFLVDIPSKTIFAYQQEDDIVRFNTVMLGTYYEWHKLNDSSYEWDRVVNLFLHNRIKTIRRRIDEDPKPFIMKFKNKTEVEDYLLGNYVFKIRGGRYDGEEILPPIRNYGIDMSPFKVIDCKKQAEIKGHLKKLRLPINPNEDYWNWD